MLKKINATALVGLVVSVGLLGIAGAATRSVPTTAFPTLKSASDASNHGDIILVNANLTNEPVFRIGKGITIKSATSVKRSINFATGCEVLTSQYATAVNFQNLKLNTNYAAGDVVSILANSGGVVFRDCDFGYAGSLSGQWAVRDYGSWKDIYFYNCFINGQVGIYANNIKAHQLNNCIIGTSNALGYLAISLNSHNGTRSQLLMTGGFVSHQGNSMGIYSWNGVEGYRNTVDLTNTSHQLVSGTYPIWLDGNTDLKLRGTTTFWNCPETYNWKKTSTDRVYNYGTIVNKNGCQNGPF